MSFGSSPGWRKTGMMIRAVLARPSGLGRRARPMFWTMSTWELREPTMHTASTPRSPVMSTPMRLLIPAPPSVLT